MIPRLLVTLIAFAISSATFARDHLALIGTYTGPHSRGIYAVRLDSATGALSTPELVAELPHPEFLALHPNGRIVYALTRVKSDDGRESGGVAAFSVDPDTGRLTPLNVESTGRGSLCHLAVDGTGRILVAASYGGGYTVSFPLQPDGRLGPRASLIAHTGPLGPQRNRQEAPHAHSVTISPDNRFAFVADLGLDRVLTYQLDLNNGTVAAHEPAFTTIPAGAGPRHTKFSPDGKFFYVLNELNGTVTACRYDAARGLAEPFENVSTFPEGHTGAKGSSEIRIHPNGRFVYAANRGDDSLAVFGLDPATGALTRQQQVPVAGQHPRNFALTPDGAWLLSGYQHSRSLSVYKVDAATGRLTHAGPVITAPTPVCILFLR